MGTLFNFGYARFYRSLENETIGKVGGNSNGFERAQKFRTHRRMPPTLDRVDLSFVTENDQRKWIDKLSCQHTNTYTCTCTYSKQVDWTIRTGSVSCFVRPLQPQTTRVYLPSRFIPNDETISIAPSCRTMALSINDYYYYYYYRI